MKYLLILLSSLLLSSPLFGQETGVLIHYETSSGFIWKSFVDKDTQPKYKGKVENGKPNGKGAYTNPDGENYEGEWKDWKRHGHGTYTFHQRFKYVGEWKDGKPWDLTIYDKNGAIIGKWIDGVLHKSNT